ncbi:MAG TPA: metallophosphoesterase [Treponemataceae bacterium]|nr:MAG: Calcineurin-like phosphoesterase superfamily domain protein [Spirochaetes bacterium ADurb.Bin215]HPA09693.1 metallophosphoesterase [Treponemataceae bacterium]HPL91605.1 metallophosphoesterase [Treponemataceae bacterium]
MKILCISDQIDPLVYSPNIRERYKDCDLVISAGDLPMEYLDFIVSSLNKPLLFVFGNHNLEEFRLYHRTGALASTGTHLPLKPLPPEACHGTTYVGFKVHREGNLLVAGVSGSIRYNAGLSQYTERQMLFRLLKMLPRLLVNKLKYGRFVDIFLTHAPPEGIHDKNDPCHRGFRCYLWFMRTFKPRFMVHGHIHLYDMQDVRVSRYFDTTVINAYSHHILDFGV